MKSYTITFSNDTNSKDRQAYHLEQGQTLLNNMLLHNVLTHSECGGKAICARCRVKILSDKKYCNPITAEEKVMLSTSQLEQGWRLACQTYCLRDVRVYLPSRSEVDNIA